eukprot:1239885-Amphidinium_carterae.1
MSELPRREERLRWSWVSLCYNISDQWEGRSGVAAVQAIGSNCWQTTPPCKLNHGPGRLTPKEGH